MSLEVWILYRNKLGSGRVVGIFSTAQKAMTCKAIRGLIGFAKWENRNDIYWICWPINKEYYFTVEPAIIDR